MFSCPSCGVVLDEEKAAVKVESFKSQVQVSIYCPVCSKLAARKIDGEDVKVNSATAPPVAAVVQDDEPE